MENWEFLIQKQGDRSWLPLESPDVEILEGRYRVVVRSSRANTDVEVRLTHQSISEVPPKRRVQKRLRRTNPEGLMVVIPFTYLKPGTWELHCSSSDLMSDLLGQSWQHAVQLQVLSQEADALGDEGPDAELLLQEIEIALSSPGSAHTHIATTSDLSELPTDRIAATTEIESKPATPLAHFLSTKNQTADGLLQFLIDSIISESEPLDDDQMLAQEQLTISSRGSENTEQKPKMLDAVALEAQLESPASAIENQPPLLINLAQPTYIGHRGQSLTISGQVEISETHLVSGEEPLQPIRAGELRIYLRNPQQFSSPTTEGNSLSDSERQSASRHELQGTRTQLLAEVRQPLPELVPPFSFTCTIVMPSDCPTQLVLGQISLYGADATSTGLVALATQSFTITADLEELLGVIAAEPCQADLPQPPPAPLEPFVEEIVTPSHPLNLAFLDLIKTSKLHRPVRSRPAAKQPLPPQICQSETERVSVCRTPKLPNIPQRLPLKTVAVSSAATNSQSELALLEAPSSMSASTAIAIAPSDSSATSPVVTTLTTHSSEKNATGSEGNDVETSAVDIAFQALHLQQRFWTRLNALANDAEFLEELKADDLDESDTISDDSKTASIQQDEDTKAAADELPNIGVLPKPEASSELSVKYPSDTDPASNNRTAETINSGSQPYYYTRTNLEWIAQEIVVDDEPLEAAEPHAANSHSNQPERVGIQASLQGFAEAEPIPMPELEVQQGELVAGQLVKVRIQLPLRPQLAIKLWVEDCQTRTLLDEPRWIADLTPSAKGGLEAIAQLLVPQGCLEIRLEAIAVDSSTQRESHKATVERTVVPPDLPSIQLDELLDA